MPVFRRLAIFAVGAVIVGGSPAISQEPAPDAGRFLLAAGEAGGFIRLDTRTGAMSHCARSDAVWTCEPLADPAFKDELAALSAEVTRLSAALDRLTQRVDGLAGRNGIEQSVAADDKRKAEPGFANAALRRLLDMVREIKRDRT